MRKYLLFVATLFSLAHGVSAQFNLRVDAGELRGPAGTTAEPVGGLLELIASPSGVFSAPTATSYVSGDNILIQSFAMNNNGGTAETVNPLGVISYTGSNYTLTPGEKLELVFYPNLTFAAMPTAPGSGQAYGQVRSDTIEFGSAGGDASETAWVVGAAGSVVDFDYVTASNGGTYANSNAYASNTVFAAVVPEPSTYALLGCGLAGLIGLRVRSRRSAARA